MIAIALDDEPLALNVLEALCAQNADIELVKTFTQPSAAKEYIIANQIDLLFLDIQMPGISGIDFFKSLNLDIKVIFTTAYGEYAVEGFNVNAVDFLLKPFSSDRFNQSIEKAKQFVKIEENQKASENNYIQVKSAYSLVNVNLDEIIIIEGFDDYIKIHLPNRKFVVTRITMKKIIETLNSKSFVRIHRSYIVPLKKLESVRNKTVTIENFKLPIGASYEEEFLKQFNSLSNN